MGFGTTLRTNIYYSHKTYDNVYELKSDIDLQYNIMKMKEQDLMMLVTMTEPAKFWRESEAEVGETPWIWMQNEAMQCIRDIKECQQEIDKLETLYYAWDDCHTKEGLAIEPAKDEKHSDSYCWGDYIKSVYPDGTVAHDPQEIIKKNWGYSEDPKPHYYD